MARQATELELRAGEVSGLDSGTLGVRVRVVEGTVWLTQAGDRRDHLLAAGERFETRAGVRVVVQALGGAASAVVEPRRVPEPCGDPAAAGAGRVRLLMP